MSGQVKSGQVKSGQVRQDLVDTPETKEGHEPSDNLTNALKVKDMVKHEDDDINDNYNHIGSVDAPLPRA